MKKREISKLSLNKKQISTLNYHNLRGGKFAVAGSDCEGTCTCNCTEVQTCGTEESECIACHSEP
ncbi:hypothetical protein C8N46_101774 [Kordia periserrulae]|uniref:Uncharacterized protein n=1 Tax=Kordia periserrulae TaxID=701523 RepID=A0A2T6C785_9FLAO|nr:hypothetical protein [Kordia periserrulae]PTX64163.1 hypothetical protein C8N46_101774 [Kordia periserrulae]